MDRYDSGEDWVGKEGREVVDFVGSCNDILSARDMDGPNHADAIAGYLGINLAGATRAEMEKWKRGKVCMCRDMLLPRQLVR